MGRCFMRALLVISVRSNGDGLAGGYSKETCGGASQQPALPRYLVLQKFAPRTCRCRCTQTWLIEYGRW